MAGKFSLAPNEAVILKEVGVAHGAGYALFTNELILTNINLVCISKGMFGNEKGVYIYPLNQLKMYNGKPQVMLGKTSTGMNDLEIYFKNGEEHFAFQTNRKGPLKKWINAINRVVLGDDAATIEEDESDYDTSTVVGAFMEVGSQVKDILGFNNIGKKKGSSKEANERITKKCISCSAPLIGRKGQVVHCKYCDTDQTL